MKIKNLILLGFLAIGMFFSISNYAYTIRVKNNTGVTFNDSDIHVHTTLAWCSDSYSNILPPGGEYKKEYDGGCIGACFDWFEIKLPGLRLTPVKFYIPNHCANTTIEINHDGIRVGDGTTSAPARQYMQSFNPFVFLALAVSGPFLEVGKTREDDKDYWKNALAALTIAGMAVGVGSVFSGGTAAAGAATAAQTGSTVATTGVVQAASLSAPTTASFASTTGSFITRIFKFLGQRVFLSAFNTYHITHGLMLGAQMAAASAKSAMLMYQTISVIGTIGILAGTSYGISVAISNKIKNNEGLSENEQAEIARTFERLKSEEEVPVEIQNKIELLSAIIFAHASYDDVLQNQITLERVAIAKKSYQLTNDVAQKYGLSIQNIDPVIPNPELKRLSPNTRYQTIADKNTQLNTDINKMTGGWLQALNKECPLGTSITGGDINNPESFVCKTCPEGTVRSQSSGLCTPCKAGTYAKGAECAPCDKNTYSNDKAKACTTVR